MDFSWGAQTPDPSIAAPTFSAKWVGQVQAQHSEVYTFIIEAPGGYDCTVILNEQMIIDSSQGENTIVYSTPTALVAGQWYDIEVAYRSYGGTAGIKLKWRTASDFPGGIIPQWAMLPSVVPNVPVTLGVYATGSTKNTLYWPHCGAGGYNIYRSTTSGGQNFMSPVNGSTPVNTPSYSGSPYRMFSDTGLTTGIRYYYRIKAVYTGIESSPTVEDADVPAVGAVPWDGRSVGAICGAFRDAFTAESPGGPLRVVGPDSTVFDESVGTPEPPDGTFIPATNQLQRPDLSTFTLPWDPSDDVAAGGRGKGPFRRVRTAPSYRGVQGDLALPVAGSIDIRHLNDFAYIYLGMADERGEVDAGLQWSPATVSWAAFMAVGGRRVGTGTNQIPPLVNSPTGNPRFPPNQTVTLRYYAWGNYTGQRARLSLLEVDGTILGEPTDIRSLGVASSLIHEERNVRVKRLHSIAQSALGVVKTGSSIVGVHWNNGRVIPASGIPEPWPLTGNEDAIYRGENFEASVTFDTPPAPLRFFFEQNIRIVINFP